MRRRRPDLRVVPTLDVDVPRALLLTHVAEVWSPSGAVTDSYRACKRYDAAKAAWLRSQGYADGVDPVREHAIAPRRLRAVTDAQLHHAGATRRDLPALRREVEALLEGVSPVGAESPWAAR